MTDAQRVAEIIERFGLSVTPARLLLVLLDAEGRILATDTIAERLRDLQGDYPTTESIRTSIKWARKALVGSEYWIEAIYGLGWRLARIDGGRGPIVRCAPRAKTQGPG